jgi:hypothetical protein
MGALEVGALVLAATLTSVVIGPLSEVAVVAAIKATVARAKGAASLLLLVMGCGVAMGSSLVASAALASGSNAMVVAPLLMAVGCDVAIGLPLVAGALL